MTRGAAHDTAIHADLWRKSSFSSGESDCVEVAFVRDGGVLVRDSKSPGASSPLAVSRENWLYALSFLNR